MCSSFYTLSGQCPTYAVTLGNPQYDCNNNMVRLGVYITWDFKVNNIPTDVDVYTIDLNIYCQPGNGTFEFKLFDTKYSLNKDIPMESREDLNFEYNSSTNILRVYGNPLPRITFKGDLTSKFLFDLYFIATDKTGIDIQESATTFCVWNFPTNCTPPDCLNPSYTAAIRFIDPNPLDGFNVEGNNRRKPDIQLPNNGLFGTTVILSAGTFQEQRIADYYGQYCFALPDDPGPIGATNYSLIVSRDGNMNCGVSSADISEIRKVILGILPWWTEPSKYVAADMNNSGHISTADITCIQKLILGKENNNNCMPPSWKFIWNLDYELFKQNNNPSGIISGGINPPFIKTLPYVPSSYSKNWAGVKMGDVNYSCQHLQTGNLQNDNVISRSSGTTYTLFVGPLQLNNGIYRIPIYASDNSTFAMFGSSFHINGAEIDGLLSGQIVNDDYMVTDLIGQNNGIHNYWTSQAGSGQSINTSSPLFYIEVSNLAANFSLTCPILDPNSPTENLLMKADGTEYDINFQLLTSSITRPINEEKAFVSPNPVTDLLSILYHSDSEGSIQISLVNQGSKVIKKETQQVQRGWNSLQLDMQEQLPGLYFVNLIDKNKTIVKKFFKN